MVRSGSSPLSSQVRRANTYAGLAEPRGRIPARDGKETETYRARRGSVRATPNALEFSGGGHRARATAGAASTNPTACGYYRKPARGST